MVEKKPNRTVLKPAMNHFRPQTLAQISAVDTSALLPTCLFQGDHGSAPIALASLCVTPRAARVLPLAKKRNDKEKKRQPEIELPKQPVHINSHVRATPAAKALDARGVIGIFG